MLKVAVCAAYDRHPASQNREISFRLGLRHKRRVASFGYLERHSLCNTRAAPRWMLFGYLGGHFSLELRISSYLRRFARNSFISSLLSKGKSRWQSQKLSLLSVSTTYTKLPSPRTESGCLWRWLEHLKTTLPNYCQLVIERKI